MGKSYSIPTARDAERFIKYFGWRSLVGANAGKGGHRSYKHPAIPGKATIPFRSGGGKDLSRQSWFGLLSQTGLTREDYDNWLNPKRTRGN